MEKNTARDCMYDPKKGFDGRDRTPSPERGQIVRKLTKAEKKKKKRGAIEGLMNDADQWEVEDPMEGVRKAARELRFENIRVEIFKRIFYAIIFLITDTIIVRNRLFVLFILRYK